MPGTNTEPAVNGSREKASNWWGFVVVVVLFVVVVVVASCDIQVIEGRKYSISKIK